jgi:SAM-dependent methyltransferase
VSQEYHRLCCDAMRPGLGQNSVDIVYCSNVLEHIPPSSHGLLFREMYRVLRPGGYVYLSWGNWLSPFGGHEHSPLHYLGSWGMNLSRRLRRLRGRFVKHHLGVNLFRTDIEGVIRQVCNSHLDLRIVDVVPRYWPQLGFICKVPWAREFLTWNCVILLRKGLPGPPHPSERREEHAEGVSKPVGMGRRHEEVLPRGGRQNNRNGLLPEQPRGMWKAL